MAADRIYLPRVEGPQKHQTNNAITHGALKSEKSAKRQKSRFKKNLNRAAPKEAYVAMK